MSVAVRRPRVTDCPACQEHLDWLESQWHQHEHNEEDEAKRVVERADDHLRSVIDRQA